MVTSSQTSTNGSYSIVGCGMKTVHVGGGRFYTGTEIADAVMTYGLELARGELTDIVEMPYLDDVGEPALAHIRIGWSVDMFTTAKCGDVGELLDFSAIFGLVDKARMLQQGPQSFE